MIKSVLRSFVINIFALWLASVYIGGFYLAEGWHSLILVGVGFSLIHLIIRPVLSLILGPLNFVTFGLIGIFIDAGLLFLMTLYFPQVSITAWTFPGFTTSYFSVPVLELNSIMSTLFSAIFIDVIRSGLFALLG